MIERVEVKESKIDNRTSDRSNLTNSALDLAYANPDLQNKKDSIQQKDINKDDLKESQEAAKKFLKDLINDGKKGEWSKESKEGFERLVKEEKQQKGATPESVATSLNAVGAAINDKLAKEGSKNQIGMAVIDDNNETKFYMQLSGPGINRADKVAAVLEDKDTKTSIKVGSMSSK